MKEEYGKKTENWDEDTVIFLVIVHINFEMVTFSPSVSKKLRSQIELIIICRQSFRHWKYNMPHAINFFPRKYSSSHFLSFQGSDINHIARETQLPRIVFKFRLLLYTLHYFIFRIEGKWETNILEKCMGHLRNVSHH